MYPVFYQFASINKEFTTTTLKAELNYAIISLNSANGEISSAISKS